MAKAKFQPTLPLRGATRILRDPTCPYRGFNPRSPCGERPDDHSHWGVIGVSTHAPLAGSDHVRQSRVARLAVSTHAPLAGSDAAPATRAPRVDSGFNPRSPCGERPYAVNARIRFDGRFNPRSPCGERRADCRTRATRATWFQPTLPLRGATEEQCAAAAAKSVFQPTLPLRGATSPFRALEGR